MSSEYPPNFEDKAALDPRAVANLIISLVHRPITNLALQKLLYFVHGAFLMRNRRPLVSGYFEAWKHGPVHPAVYEAFKGFEAQPITSFAQRRDLRSGTMLPIPMPEDREVVSLARKTVASLEDLTAGQLVRLSHAKDGPWDVVFRRSKSEHMLGLRISNDLIRDKYRHHWFSAEKLDEVDEPSEDTPLTYYRFS